MPPLRSLALAVALLACVVPTLNAQDTLTPQQVAAMQRVTSARISPDGSAVAYTRSVPREPGVDEDGSAWSELYLMDVESGESRPFITGHQSVRSVAWTKDGRGLAFLAKRSGDDHTSLYVIPIDGGEARRAVALGSSIRSYSFSPDGSKVALVATDPDDKDRKALQKKGFKQEVYEEDTPYAHLWIATPFDEDREARRLEPEGSLHGVAWSPVDDRVAVIAAPTPLTDDSLMRKRVRVIDSNTGAVLARIDNPGKLGQIGWCPDGEHIAMIATESVHDPSAGRLLIASSGGGALRNLLPDYQGQVETFRFQNAEEVMYLASEGVWSVFAEVKIDGSAQQDLASGGPILTSFTLSRDGQSGAFVGEAPQHPGELFTMRHGDSGPARRTNSNPWLDSVRLGKQELITFAARDGLEIEGLLMHPVDAEPGKRHPLIMYVHGGPESHHSNGWLTRYANPGQVAAGRGFYVFHTNYRGSTGRGVEFSMVSQSDAAGAEFDDLVDAVDHLVERGLVDTDRVAVTGGSYGGYATAWLSTRYSERFAAGVMFVGISNKVSKVGTTDIPDEEYLVHARHRIHEGYWMDHLERSPVYHAGSGETPLLIMHGKDDPRVNKGQSMELYRHLKVHGKAPVRLVFYPGEGHGNRRAGAQYDYNLRSLRWIEHYLTGPGGALPELEIDYALED